MELFSTLGALVVQRRQRLVSLRTMPWKSGSAMCGRSHSFGGSLEGDTGLLQIDCRTAFSATESARGVALVVGAPAPRQMLGDTPEFYKDLMTGTSCEGMNFDTIQVAGEVKGSGALFFAAWARKNPNYFVLTVSPAGGTIGTSLVQHHSSVPWIVRKSCQFSPPFWLVGLHSFASGSQEALRSCRDEFWRVY
jgi:hypothetical protein